MNKNYDGRGTNAFLGKAKFPQIPLFLHNRPGQSVCTLHQLSKKKECLLQNSRAVFVAHI